MHTNQKEKKIPLFADNVNVYLKNLKESRNKYIDIYIDIDIYLHNLYVYNLYTYIQIYNLYTYNNLYISRYTCLYIYIYKTKDNKVVQQVCKIQDRHAKIKC